MDKLAQALKLAAQVREKSFDHIGEYYDGVVKLIKARRKHEAGETVGLFDLMVETSQYYKVDLWDAADHACDMVGFDERGTMPVYLLLKNSWNDSLGWAEAQFK